MLKHNFLVVSAVVINLLMLSTIKLRTRIRSLRKMQRDMMISVELEHDSKLCTNQFAQPFAMGSMSVAFDFLQHSGQSLPEKQAHGTFDRTSPIRQIPYMIFIKYLHN
jgi:hypothetical protein